MKTEIKEQAELIVKAHGGQAYFNFAQASKIIGCGINTMPHEFHKAGITVKRVGPSKRVSAYDIAELMCTGRVAPID